MRKIAIRYGLILFLSLTVFFLLMDLFGLVENVWLRLINGVFHIAILYLAIRNYKFDNPRTFGNYLSGIATGMYTTVIGVIPFAVIVAIYFNINSGLLLAVQDHITLERFMNPANIGAFVFVEGIGVAVIGSYIITRIVNMQMLKGKTGQDRVNEYYSRDVYLSVEKDTSA